MGAFLQVGLKEGAPSRNASLYREPRQIGMWIRMMTAGMPLDLT